MSIQPKRLDPTQMKLEFEVRIGEYEGLKQEIMKGEPPRADRELRGGVHRDRGRRQEGDPPGGHEPRADGGRDQ